MKSHELNSGSTEEGALEAPLFTVLTATYNRAGTLSRVYDSLMAQTLRDFEWVVVDDGSDDDTASLLEGWRKRAAFPIRYFWQSNRGKYVAVNRGVREARGEYCVIFDSDDACVANALERFAYHWEQIGDRRDEFAAVVCLCQDQFGRVVGNEFPRDFLDSTPAEMTYRYHVRGDKWAASRLSVNREFPLPESPEWRWMDGGAVGSAIARRYVSRYVNEPLRVYWVPGRDGVGNHLSHPPDPFNRKRANNMALAHALRLNRDLGWWRWNPRLFFRIAVLYIRYAFHARWGLWKQLSHLRPAGLPLWIVALPAGLAVFARDAIRVWTHR